MLCVRHPVILLALSTRSFTSVLTIPLLVTVVSKSYAVSAWEAPVLRNVTAPTYHGEGCFWDERIQSLYYVDIIKELVKRFDPATGELTDIHLEGGAVSLVVPISGSLNKLLVTHGREVLLVDWDGKSSSPLNVDYITSVEPEKPDNQFNDGKADSRGRLWLGTMGAQPVPGDVVPNQGALYCLSPDSEDPVKHVAPVSVSNGIIWSHDDKLMYFIDSPTELIEVFDYDIETANISNRRTVFNLTQNNITGIPDGMTIDADDNLWVAVFYGGKVLNINPKTGELIRTVDFPVTLVSDVVFGGPELSLLYVTSSQYGLSDEELAEQPLAGSVFEVAGLGVRGARSHTAFRMIPPN